MDNVLAALVVGLVVGFVAGDFSAQYHPRKPKKPKKLGPAKIIPIMEPRQ